MMNAVAVFGVVQYQTRIVAALRAVTLAALSMLLLCKLAACTSTTSAAQPREYLDPQTAATITLAAQPMVFARDRPELAANVRDYVTLAAVAVNRSGKLSYYWVAYFWSTLDARSAAEVAASEAISHAPLLLADDRRVALGTRMESSQAAIGIEPHRPPGVITEPMIYPVTLDMLRFVAASRRLRLLASNDPTELPYDLWRDERGALAKLVTQLSPH